MLSVVCHSLAIETVVDFEQLSGTQNESFMKEMSTAGRNVLETFQFQSPYAMRPHGDTENGLNWDDGHIPAFNCPPSLTKPSQASHI